MEFRSPTIDDAQWAVPLLETDNFMGSEFAFSNVYIWQDVVDMKISKFEDFVLVRADYGGDCIHYQYPCGKGDIKPAIDAILKVAETGDRPPAITSIPHNRKDLVEELYPGIFDFSNPRGNSDYVYLSSDLANLEGSKFRKKRNHISNFERSYPNWEFKEITEDKIVDIMEFTQRWQQQNKNDTEGINDESLAIKRALDNYSPLNLKGGYLTVDDEIVAYSYGRPMGDEFITHVEKGLYDINGAYAFINREMARTFGKDYTYINREDDVDEPGLRKAKLSYRPEFLVDKWRAEPKIWPPHK